MRRIWWLLLLLSASTVADQELYIESVVEPEQPYIQQQTSLTLKVYRRSHLQRGYFLKPEIANALVKQAEPIAPSVAVKDGREFELLQQRYLLFPQRSGEWILPAPVFSSNNLFIKGEPIKLTVKPKPDNHNTDHWLVAGGVVLKQQWQMPPEPWRVGDHLIRVVSMEGEGVMGVQLPEVIPVPLEGMQVETIGQEIGEYFRDGVLFGTRLQRIRYIARHGGLYTVPRFRVEWWDAKRQRLQSSEIAGRIFDIAPALASPLASDSESVAVAKSITEEEKGESDWHSWLSHGVIVLGLLLITVGVVRYRLLSSVKPQVKLLILTWRLSWACLGNRPKAVKRVLELWVGDIVQHGMPCNLPKLAERTTGEGDRQALLALDRALYANQPNEWRGWLSLGPIIRLLYSARWNTKADEKAALPLLWEGHCIDGVLTSCGRRMEQE